MKLEFLVNIIATIVSIIFFVLVFITALFILEIISFVIGQSVSQNVKVFAICYILAVFVIGSMFVARKIIHTIRYF